MVGENSADIAHLVSDKAQLLCITAHDDLLYLFQENACIRRCNVGGFFVQYEDTTDGVMLWNELLQDAVHQHHVLHQRP